MAKFVKEEGVALENHVIATVTAADQIKCRLDCVDTPLCFSVNVRKLGATGRVKCELNNSSKTADPQDLIPSAGTHYYQMAVIENTFSATFLGFYASLQLYNTDSFFSKRLGWKCDICSNWTCFSHPVTCSVSGF